jgi:CRP-like cAMP-binding protein
MALAPAPSVLHGSELFSALSDEALAEVLGLAQVRRLPKGTRAFAQGDPGATCHSLLTGRVKVAQTRPDGEQAVIRFIGPGEMFGTIAALMGRPFPAEAVAVVDSVEAVWTVERMRELMERFPEIAMRSVSAAGSRLAELQARLGELSAERVEQRIARALARLARHAGRRTPAGVEIDFPITRQELAEMTGSTLHTVSRTLAAWDARGVTESSRRHIVVRQPHALIAIAEDLPDASAG